MHKYNTLSSYFQISNIYYTAVPDKKQLKLIGMPVNITYFFHK